MDDFYIKWRRSQNIRPLILPNKEQYYSDLLNIEHSWSGRMDVDMVNTFIMEAEQQLINAIELFEQGYFDCAYYSLRSAVDISTTIVFFADMPYADRERYLADWKNTSKFPMQREMIRRLFEKGDIFIDMREKMPNFFEDAKVLSAELNKYVHKQGLQHFYISRNHAFNANESQDTFIALFEGYLERCIGVVAVMRLAIDPFPILLMDDEILYRCFDSMTEPYSQDFVDKYIGHDLVNRYKRTDFYSNTYDSFMNEEKKNEATFNVMKHQYIDSRRMAEIYPQLHLLSFNDTVSVLLVASNSKIVKAYCCGGLLMFFTDRNTNRKKKSWSTADFIMFENSDEPFNQPYDESYISVFDFKGDKYFAEHNEILADDEISEIINFTEEALDKI